MNGATPTTTTTTTDGSGEPVAASRASTRSDKFEWLASACQFDAMMNSQRLTNG